MRTIPSAMKARWEAGGPFIGLNGRVNGYVTVEPAWYLHDAEDFVIDADPTKLPFRFFQDIRNTQVEVVIPGITSIVKDRTFDADAGTCELTMLNTVMGSHVGNPGGVGQVGYFSWDYGKTAAAARWGQIPNSWQGVLIPNALLRTYQGFGGWHKVAGKVVQKPLADALAEGSVILTGVWLIDEVRPATNGQMMIKCRDMFKLLIEQPVFTGLMGDGSGGLINRAWYPLTYYRFTYTPQTRAVIPVYNFTHPVEAGPGAEGNKYVTDFALSPDAQGYTILGSDGGIFPFGPSARGWGSRGAITDDGPMVGIAMEPFNDGFWMCTSTGGVFPFGACQFYGAPHGAVSGLIVRIRSTPTGLGYWLLSDDGSIYAYGDAVHHGGNPAFTHSVVDFVPTPTGLGYWMLDWAGHVYAFGDAVYHGGAAPSIDPCVGIAARRQGDGYWIAHQSGVIEALGAAQLFPAELDWPLTFDPPATLTDPLFAIQAMPSNNGYCVIDGRGQVFAFGDGVNYGGLPNGGHYLDQGDGNYLDYRDIVKDLLRWSGFLAYGDGGDNDDVFGLLETTGAYSKDTLPVDMFDKKPVIDPLKQIKELVGFQLFCGDTGEARFQQPNWYAPGNRLEDGTHVDDIPVIDERVQLFGYEVPYNDVAARSEVIISSGDPDPKQGLTGLVTTATSINSPLLRGMKRPAMWINGSLTDAKEQQRMLQLILRHLEFAYRPGTVTMVANPAIQMNDQVRIYERVTAETAIHYVRGVHDEMHLGSDAEPSWIATLSTYWLGEPSDFTI